MTATQYMKKGQVVFHEGSRSDFAFIIENGQVEVSRRRKDGNVEVLDILGKNEIFGEMGMVDGGPRTATITALENSKVTMISREDLNLMTRKDPKAWFPIVKAMSARLRRSTTKEKKYLRNAGLVRNK
ncbi:MAG: cyclic nucleotide-binding domain-containing protein [Nitrospinota bacterium]|jgi:CRP-like cAMP-binding protein|nr:cyclic nucleotide-binding domain-containing protein [Nitrospinota bacterium]